MASSHSPRIDWSGYESAAPQVLAFKGFDAYTGGSQGVQVPKPGPLLGLHMNVDQSVYWLCLVVAVGR